MTPVELIQALEAIGDESITLTFPLTTDLKHRAPTRRLIRAYALMVKRALHHTPGLKPGELRVWDESLPPAQHRIFARRSSRADIKAALEDLNVGDTITILQTTATDPIIKAIQQLARHLGRPVRARTRGYETILRRTS